MKVRAQKTKIFKIRNRQGYACVCVEHLTEGKTPFEAYQRMKKALRRSGMVLEDADAATARKRIVHL